MSAAVRAALAVKRAEHRSRSRSTSPTKPVPQQDDSHLLPNFGSELDASLSSPFGSPKPKPKDVAPGRLHSVAALSTPTDASASLNQRSEADIVRASVANGKINLSARAPSLEQVPDLVLTLLSDEPPRWYTDIPEEEREPWFSREELHTLQMGNNELQQLPERLCDFQGLKRLELYSNRLTSLPSRFYQLTTLTSLSLANNGLTAFPTCLLALDNLVTLSLSNNKIQTLWSDSDVLAARSERESWDKLNAMEENGIWAGLSPSKKDRKALLPEAPREAPLRGLRTLDLSNNRLNNAALGIPVLSGPPGKDTPTDPVRLPLGLKRLDLAHNPVRGPVSTALFIGTRDLEDLSLRGCGIADNVFASNDSAYPVLASLTTLDVSGCEIDALDPLEALFGSRRIKGTDQALGLREDYDQDSTLPSTTPGLAPRQLVRITNRPNATDLAKMEQIIGGKVLCVLLDGNLLREEGFRQKRGGSPKKAQRIAATDPVVPSMSPKPDASPKPDTITAPAASKPSQSGLTPPSGLPAKPTVIKEEWELLAESGLNTELGRRKLRIEQARRAQEEALAAANLNENETRGRSRAIVDDVHTRSASKSAGADAGPSKEKSPSKDRVSGQDDSADDSAAGSALANAKLSTKKKEALGQVPCKFFRSNGCSAGASCPFAHTLPGDIVQKSVCQWFLKGSCRFGHKCALAHVLPGQPMSMDRKNKRAAQHGQPLPQMAHQPPQMLTSSQSPSQAQTTAATTLTSAVSSNFNPATANFQPSQNKLPSNLARPHQQQEQVPQSQAKNSQSRQSGNKADPLFHSRDHDFPFGLPDDLQATSTQAPAAKRPAFESSQSASATSALPPIDGAVFRNTQRPGSLSQSYSASFASPSLGSPGGLDSAAAAAAFGSSTAARALGTSPFSHPGGHGLFFSGSQDSEGGAGPFARNSRDQLGARSANRLDDPAGGRWWSGGGANRMAQGGITKEEEIQDAEGLLPSSLSDLLTPVELERRGRNGRLSNSFAANEERVPIAQSMPSHGPGLGRGGKTPIGAQRSLEPQASNLSAGLLQHQQSQWPPFSPAQAQYLRESKSGEGLRPFEDARPLGGGLDSIAFRESGSGAGFVPSDGRSAIQHAPGQSLPQGLAAGLSQLHLRTGTGVQDNAAVQRGGISSQLSGNANAGGFGSADKLGAYSTSQLSQSGGSALRLPSSLDDYGLGPTAPSSMLAHRSPLIFATSGSFGSPGTGSGNAHFPSPPLSAIGSQRASAGTGEIGTGIAIPDSSSLVNNSSRQQQLPISRYANSMQHQYQHSYAQHPGMQRLRAGSSTAPTPHSPLSLPVATAEEDEDEAIFELE